MSVLSGASAPTANHELANVVAALLSSGQRPAAKDLRQQAADQLPERASQPAASLLDRLVTGATGRGTSAARLLRPSSAAATGPPASDESSQQELSCPAAGRADRAPGEQVNAPLLDWTKQVGIHPGQLDRLHKASIGRLMILAHSASGRHLGGTRR